MAAAWHFGLGDPGAGGAKLKEARKVAPRSSALEKKHRRSGAAIAVGGMGLCVGGTYLTLKTHA